MNNKTQKGILQYQKRYCNNQQKLVKLPLSTREHTTQFMKLSSKDINLSQGLGHTQKDSNIVHKNRSLCNSASSNSSNNNAITSHANFVKHWPKSNLKNVIQASYDDEKKNSNNKYEFTEQRHSYECLARLTPPKVNNTDSATRSSTCANYLQTCTDDNASENQKEAYGDSIDAKFYSLQEFRLKNINDCFGEQRQLEILYQQPRQQRHDVRKQQYISSTSDDDNYCISTPYESNVIAKRKKNYENFNKTIPYQLKQRQLREEIIKEFKNNKFRLTKSKQLALSPSLALDYQPMY